MARARNIKPGLFKNEILGVADPLYTILFEGLWVLADREGRLEHRPLRIKGETFPYRDSLDMEAMLNWLAHHEFIEIYEVGGKKYIQILSFSKHQNPHKNEQASTIPKMPVDAPKGEEAKDEGVPKVSEDAPIKSEALGLIPDSLDLDPLVLIPDSLDGASAGESVEDGEDPDADGKQPEKPKRRCRIPDDFELTEDRQQAACSYWLTRSRSDLNAQTEFEKFVAHHTAHGKPMLDWDAAWKTWYCNAIKFNRPPIGVVKPDTGQARSFDQIDYTNGVTADGRF